jgi:hypothetical protein
VARSRARTLGRNGCANSGAWQKHLVTTRGVETCGSAQEERLKQQPECGGAEFRPPQAAKFVVRGNRSSAPHLISSVPGGKPRPGMLPPGRGAHSVRRCLETFLEYTRWAHAEATRAHAVQSFKDVWGGRSAAVLERIWRGSPRLCRPSAATTKIPCAVLHVRPHLPMQDTSDLGVRDG